MTGVPWAQWITKGDVLVDVGANTGAFTKSFAMATGPTGKVIAFEPDPSMAAQVRKMATTLSTPIEVRECAVGARQESSPFYISKQSPQNTRYQATIARAVTKELVVECVTLDEELSGVTVNGLKIDTQGDDGWVLTGARETLARMPSGSWLLFELWPEGLRQSGFDLCAFTRLCQDWAVVADGKTYSATTQRLSDLVAAVQDWRAHKHTNVLLRKG